MENIDRVIAAGRQKQLEAKLLQLVETDPLLSRFVTDSMKRAVRAEQRVAELERQAAELAGGRGQVAEIESLRQQLEQECAARQIYADSIKTLQSALEKEQHEYKELAAIVRKQAEVIREVNTVLPAVANDIKSKAARSANQQGLTFPYTTKELEVMRAAVAQYWEDYTPDKRQPKQRVVGHAIGELLGLPPQSNGDPARKAIALASAIKPDTLPDA